MFIPAELQGGCCQARLTPEWPWPPARALLVCTERVALGACCKTRFSALDTADILARSCASNGTCFLLIQQPGVKQTSWHMAHCGTGHKVARDPVFGDTKPSTLSDKPDVCQRPAYFFAL